MTSRPATFTTLILFAMLAACAAQWEESDPGAIELAREEPDMNRMAESYIKLALALGRHDEDYVDAYYGPSNLKEEVEAEPRSLDDIGRRARSLRDDLRLIPAGEAPLDRARHRSLSRHLESLIARVDLVAGKAMTFDEESQALYDAVAPTHELERFEAVLKRLERSLPGEGDLTDRYTTYRAEFTIPADRLDSVFDAAIAACRERTARHIELPPGESFKIEYVTGKSWSGYNWYQGNFRSLIQVNTDLPIYVDRALDLACHEGYPGHHVFHSLVERTLVHDRGWIEYTVQPLFVPHSLLAEGTANYGIEIAFPGPERVAFEREVLFPLAGVDPSRADEYYEIHTSVKELRYAGNEAARRYLDGQIDARRAAEWLARYTLMSPARAEQRVRFIEQYRSYVINYNLGEDLVRRYVETQAGPEASSEEMWRVFGDLLAAPKLPSELG
jgi:hypothetical protein